MLAQLICLIIVSAASTYIGYQLGLWARDEVRKYGSLRKTVQYIIIDWLLDRAYNFNAPGRRETWLPTNKKTGKEKTRQNMEGYHPLTIQDDLSMTDYERKLDYLIHSEELPF